MSGLLNVRWFAASFSIAAVAMVMAIAVGDPASAFLSLPSGEPRPVPARNLLEPRSYDELIRLPEGAMASVDIGRANLLCAQGLPGAERVSIDACLSVLDTWGRLAHQGEEKYLFSEAEMRSEKYLKTLTPAEEIAVFADIRAMCLQEHGRLHESAQAYAAALRGFPDSEQIKAHLAHVRGGR